MRLNNYPSIKIEPEAEYEELRFILEWKYIMEYIHERNELNKVRRMNRKMKSNIGIDF